MEAIYSRPYLLFECLELTKVLTASLFSQELSEYTDGVLYEAPVSILSKFFQTYSKSRTLIPISWL